MPRSKIACHWKKHRALFCVPLLAVLDTLLIELFNQKAFTAGLGSLGVFLRERPLAFAVNAFLVLLTLAPAFFLRRRVFWCVLVSALWVVCGAANGFILLNRVTPFTIADLTVLNTGLDTLPNYLPSGYLLLLSAAVLILVISLLLLGWKGPKNALSGRRRILEGATALGLTAALLAGTWVLAFHAGQLSSLFASLATAYEDYGFSYCFLQTWLNTGIRRPNGYSGSDMARIQGLLEKDALPADPQTDVNVICVQLESFLDPGQIKGLVLSENPVPNWTAMRAAYSSGYLTVPVVGAGTANTEFEVLTGMSVRLFGPGEYPYKTCLLDQTVESLAYNLKAHGYAAHAIHNHQAAFYSRDQVYPNLGFDDFTSLEYMPAVKTTAKNWAKDDVLTGEIAKALDATPDQPDLVFTVSVQGHGNYPMEPVLADPAVTVVDAPAHVDGYAVEYYVNQIHEVDAFLGELTAMLSQREERTVLVLYGDHLPSLGLTPDDVAAETLYDTEYILWDNFGLPQADGDLYAYQLSSSVLGRLGIATGELNAFHQFCREEPTYRTDLARIQYDVLYGKSYLYGGEKSPYPPQDMKMGCVPMEITGFWERDGQWYVTGRNFSPYCQVTAAGDRLETEVLSPWLLRLEEEPDGTDRLGLSVVDRHGKVLSATG